MDILSSLSPKAKANELYTINEVAALLKVHRNTAYSLVKSGRIKSVQLSQRRTRVTRRALENYVESLEAEAARPLISREKLRRAGRI